MPEPDGETRPIAIEMIQRRIFARAVSFAIQKKAVKKLPGQFGIGIPRGAEAIAHRFQAIREAAKGDPVKLARYAAPGAPPSKPCASDPIVSSAPDTYFIRDTCDRGPLLLAAAKAQALRFFDDEIFWMEGSEHDLFCRGQRHGWVTGVVNIPVNSPWQLKAGGRQLYKIRDLFYINRGAQYILQDYARDL